jgi:sec-independent protein translocase protein TatB
MPDLGWSEILTLVVIAIVVVGPRELPGLMRQIARFTKAARHAAQEFRDSLDELARETELEEIERAANKRDYDTPDSIVDPTTGRSAPRRSLLPEKSSAYEPPAEGGEDLPLTTSRDREP